jgi:hypothetical protein
MPPPRESFVDPVPVGNAVFTKSPAEVHLFPIGTDMGKVNQSAVHVPQENAPCVKLTHNGDYRIYFRWIGAVPVRSATSEILMPIHVPPFLVQSLFQLHKLMHEGMNTGQGIPSVLERKMLVVESVVHTFHLQYTIRGGFPGCTSGKEGTAGKGPLRCPGMHDG